MQLAYPFKVSEKLACVHACVTYFSPRFSFRWLIGLIWREEWPWVLELSNIQTFNIHNCIVIVQLAPEKCTFWGLMAATGGEPGGLCETMSAVKVWLAICMHSSRVLRKVVHVDFTMFPVSSPACRNDHGHTQGKHGNIGQRMCCGLQVQSKVAGQ